MDYWIAKKLLFWLPIILYDNKIIIKNKNNFLRLTILLEAGAATIMNTT
jgi:hypothetical protein